MATNRLSEGQKRWLANRIPWGYGFHLSGTTLVVKGAATYDNLAVLARVFDTRDINIESTIEHGYYPGDATAETEIRVGNVAHKIADGDK